MSTYLCLDRSDIGAALAAGSAGEQRLDIGAPKAVWPAIGIHGDGVAALVIGAEHRYVATASGAHLSESDLLLRLHRVARCNAGAAAVHANRRLFVSVLLAPAVKQSPIGLVSSGLSMFFATGDQSRS